MEKGEIIRVWGKADNYDLVFTKGADGRWRTAVPPDLTDGQYATEIHALNTSGQIAIWSGILYMHNGQACLHLQKRKYAFCFMPKRRIAPKYDRGPTKCRLEFMGVCAYE